MSKQTGGGSASGDTEDLNAIVAGALVVLDQVDALEPYLPDLSPDDRERVDAYVGRASAGATLRAYKSDWRLFCAWCQESGYRPLPATPATVAAFLTLLAEVGFTPTAPRETKRGKLLPRKEPLALGKATIGRRLAAIVFAHRAADRDARAAEAADERGLARQPAAGRVFAGQDFPVQGVKDLLVFRGALTQGGTGHGWNLTLQLLREMIQHFVAGPV